MRAASLTATVLMLASGALAHGEDLVKPGVRYAVIDTPHLHVIAPADQADALGPFIRRAEMIYVAMARDAGYEIRERLDLLLTDDTDDHNGFSTVVPLALVNIRLAPAQGRSAIFAGHGELERTLIHELAHHISNDRDAIGLRRGLRRAFGRVLPYEPLSLLLFYLSTPAHITSPTFWHEGLAQWAETAYAPPGPWSGRGRDSLSHMPWRLDTAADAMPEAPDWRLSYPRWPHGNRTYLYGLAYLRYLDAAYGDRADAWALIRRQQHRWAFIFNGGPQPLLGKTHLELITEARAALIAEQQAQIAILRSVPLTDAVRLTAPDTIIGAPAWMPDGCLFAAVDGPYARPGFSRIHGDGRIVGLGRHAFAMGGARSLPDGTLVFAETPVADDPWARSRITILTADGRRLTVPGERRIEPDVRQAAPGDAGLEVAAIRLLPAGGQDLVLTRVGDDGDAAAERTLAVEGSPWTPAFRPGRDELAWVETDIHGSRLVLAPLADPARRTVLAQVAGRILHPAWTADGARVFICADHSGVANAYAIDPAQPGRLVAATHTLGGVVACVPSPDGLELALIDHDHRGPFLARRASDPAIWPGTIPSLTLAWPATLPADATRAPGPALRSIASGDDGDGASMTSRPYNGLRELRPLFWTPTTYAVPEGGLGVIGAAADPLATHQAVASVGVGPVEGSFIGSAAYTWSTWPIDAAVIAWRSELTYDGQVADAFLNRYDYTETVATAEVRAGYGLAGFKRRYQAFVAAGVSDSEGVDASTARYRGGTLISTPLFNGSERYVEATLGYSSTTFFPTSYAAEDGTEAAIRLRHAGFGGSRDGNRAIATASRAISIWPAIGLQAVAGGAFGWSDGEAWLQGRFTVGGNEVYGYPRGYPETRAVGDHLLAGSVALRAPLYRPFVGYGTTPFVLRQVVLEGFYDVAKASIDRPGGDGRWYRSVGGALHVNAEVYYVPLNPGILIARQLDGDEDTTASLVLGFRW